MNYIFKITLFLATVGLLATGCKKDNLTAPVDRTTVPRTIGEFIENNYDLSLLRAALEKTGMLDTLKQPGSLTFYAPDNAAFNAMGVASKADVDKMNTDSLRFMLRFHGMRNRYFITTFPDQLDNKFSSLAGPNLYVSVGKGSLGPAKEDRIVYVNGTMIMPGSKRNISLVNGVIHILRRPLKYTVGTVQDYVAADTSLTLFAAIMKKFGYWDGLKTKNPLTVFAPANAAFLKYGLTADSIARMVPDNFKQLAFGVYPLLMKPAHVFSTDANAISGETVSQANGILVDAYSICPNYTYSAYNNQEDSPIWTYIKKGDGQWSVNDAGPVTVRYKGGLINADHLTANGIVHVIDDLIFNPAKMRK